MSNFTATVEHTTAVPWVCSVGARDMSLERGSARLKTPMVAQLARDARRFLRDGEFFKKVRA